uniref:Vacuolar protein sorting-associated protein 62 n=1 Tax=Chenopodium quinoa TaxID=63459 RepID=A0A803N520_CHEQI
MFGCQRMNGNYSINLSPSFTSFLLPAPLPTWPQGRGFATGTINLGELEVAEITRFEFVWGSHLSHDKRKGVSFYKPLGLPEGFFSLGHYCQPNGKPLNVYVLVAKDSVSHNRSSDSDSIYSPALMMPLDYSLVWVSDDGMGIRDQPGHFWLPIPPSSYRVLGFVVSTLPGKPELDEISLKVFETRPCNRGMLGKGVSAGTFFCSSTLWTAGEEMPIVCLKNKNSKWQQGMPTIDQIHTLIHHYGPIIFFHPKEVYFPSSVSWFFVNGALLFKSGQSTGEPISADGSILPFGGTNDGKFWIDIPYDDRRKVLKHGDLESAELYAHVKPALGGTFTDIAMWVFSPFNGPATLKVGPTNVPLKKTGEHIGDWEHFTLRISNFTSELHRVYFSQHSGGQWISACDLEFIEGNRAILYSSRSGHASFPHPGTYLQGSSSLGIGIRNDCSRSNFYLDSSTQYQIVAAEYLGNDVTEPCWLQFMREWGPKIVYDSRKEFDKIIKRLPRVLRGSVTNLIGKLPAELSKEEGPTGPKEKDNWLGDERW